MKKILSVFILFLMAFSGCARNTGGPLVYKKFKDSNTFLIACSGGVKEGTVGAARFESAKRAALMNVYYFIKEAFDDTVVPGRDGIIDRVDFRGDIAVVHFILKKNNLKGRLK